MHAMMQQKIPTDFVVGSGKVHSVRDLVRIAFAAVGIVIDFVGHGFNEKGVDTSTGEVIVEVDSKYIRPNEVSFLKGDPRRMHAALGWEAVTSFEEMISQMVRADFIAAKNETGKLKTGGVISIHP